MSDTPAQKPSLTEIGHLFLSSVRDRQPAGGAPARPQRISPQARAQASIDVTPEELARQFDPSLQADHHDAPASDDLPGCRVSAIVAGHLNGHGLERAVQYARHLAENGDRVALLEIDTHELRLMCFDRDATPPEADGAQPIEHLDERDVVQTIEELSWDVERFLFYIPNPRTAEARALLSKFGHWVLLSTCDHEGVVMCYRTLKGLSEIHRPALSLAVLDAADEIESEKIFNKIAGVCHHFLSMPMESEGLIAQGTDVVEHTALWWRSEERQPDGQHWQAISRFVSRFEKTSHPSVAPATAPATAPIADIQDVLPRNDVPDHFAALQVTPHDQPTPKTEDTKAAPMNDPFMFSRNAEPNDYNAPIPMPLGAVPTAQPSSDDVIDLPEHAANEAGLLGAVLKHTGGEYVECPVKAPQCPAAVMTVNRDRKLVLHAVARQGLSDLRAIAQAYRWMNENRALIAMALPQFSIDTHVAPTLRVLVDHADISADILQPLMESRNVKVQSYRKLKWGGRTGLLLEAA